MVGVPSKPRLRVLFAFSHLGYLRNFERTIQALCAAGHTVHVAYGKEHESIVATEYEADFLDRIHLHALQDEPELPADPIAFLRLFRDTMFFARKEFRQAHFLRKRFLENKIVRKQVTPKMLSALEALPASDRLLIDDLLARIDASHPPSAIVSDLVEEIAPDVIVVSPYLVLFSREVEFVKVAQNKGIPCVYAAASWDNLTTKNVIKVQPDAVAVWNDAMAKEARTLHRVDKRRIHVTGAPVFDWWFETHRAWDRQTFLDAVGFDADRPILLYVCSSTAIGGNELEVVDRWLKTVRSSSDPRLRDANILVRPHPVAIDIWQERIAAQARGETLGYRIAPTAVSYPTRESQRTDFFNAIFHAAAIVGLNTSAMIEAAILDKPVLTFTGHGSEDSQIGNLHFRHLVESRCVHVAESMDAHAAALAAALREPQKHSGARKRFIREFVRPLGESKAPSSVLAELIATTADSRRTETGGAGSGLRRLLMRKPAALARKAAGSSAPVTAGTHVPSHWLQTSWEEKAQENPLFAIMTTPEFADASPADFSDDELAAFFAKGKKLFRQHLRPLLEEVAKHEHNALVVEYGCGAGRVLKCIAEAGYRCAGIDISKTMLDHCRKLVPEVEGLHLLDASGRTGLAGESASLVYSYDVLQHIALLSNFVTALDEMCRVLRPGGTLAVQVNCQDFESGDLSRPWQTENHEHYSLHFRDGSAKPYLRHEQDNWSGVYIGRDFMEDLLRERGVRIDRWYYHNPRKLRAVWAIGRKSL